MGEEEVSQERGEDQLINLQQGAVTVFPIPRWLLRIYEVAHTVGVYDY